MVCLAKELAAALLLFLFRSSGPSLIAIPVYLMPQASYFELSHFPFKLNKNKNDLHSLKNIVTLFPVNLSNSDSDLE